MTFFVTALTNDKARLIAKELSTSCEVTAMTVKAMWEGLGYIVIYGQEE